MGKKGKFMLAVMFVLLLAGCGGNSQSLERAAVESSYPSSSANTEDAGYGEMESLAEMPEALQQAKLILRAEIHLETMDFEQTASALDEAMNQVQGYYEIKEINNNNGYSHGYYVIRIPKEHYRQFIQSANGIGHVVNLRESSEDVGAAYYDTELRLRTQKTKYERLQALLNQAEQMEDIIAIEQALAEVEYAIDQLSGSLRNYDYLVDYATVTVSMLEVYRLSNITETPKGFGQRLGSALVDGTKNFVQGLENLVIWVAYYLFDLTILAIVVILAVRGYRWRKKKKGQQLNKPE